MSQNKKAARELFPNIPEEIFELWLDGRIENNGWPPNGSRWEGALRSKTWSYWANLKWKKARVDIGLNLLTEPSVKILIGLGSANFCDVPNIYSRYMGDDSKRRIKSISEYLMKYSKLPGHLIFIYDEGKYEIVDGCHRLTTLFWEQGGFPSEMMPEVWIGELAE